MTRALILAQIVVLAGCGSSESGFAGTYNSSFTGTYNNTSPSPQSGSYTDTATVTVTDKEDGKVLLVWQVGTNPPSGSILFALDGSKGTAVTGTGTDGSCFTGKLTNGNTQTSCCDACTISFSGASFTQNQSGHYTGTTPQNVAYSGNYTGTWAGTRTSSP
jgi:hypothetical protein